jgi:two-component system NtrC family response regulator
MSYPWPGNVRQLENVVQRMIVIATGETLDVQDLPAELRDADTAVEAKENDFKGLSKEITSRTEKSRLLDALTEHAWNVTRTARAIGISRATLQNKMKKLNLRTR